MICRPRRSRVEPARPGEAHVTRGKVSGSELCVAPLRYVLNPVERRPRPEAPAARGARGAVRPSAEMPTGVRDHGRCEDASGRVV